MNFYFRHRAAPPDLVLLPHFIRGAKYSKVCAQGLNCWCCLKLDLHTYQIITISWTIQNMCEDINTNVVRSQDHLQTVFFSGPFSNSVLILSFYNVLQNTYKTYISLISPPHLLSPCLLFTKSGCDTWLLYVLITKCQKRVMMRSRCLENTGRINCADRCNRGFYPCGHAKKVTLRI